MTVITDEMKMGWNACRRQVYLLAEHEQDKGPYSEDKSDFARGYRFMAKSFAKAFNAFEADDCDFMKEAALSALDEGQKPVAWHVYAKNWGDELVFSEKEATAAAERLRTIAGVKEPKVVPLYDRPSSDLREELERLRKALEPFAAWSEILLLLYPKELDFVAIAQLGDREAGLTHDQLRAAIAALQSSSQGER